eukprot:CAMPEP_0202096916 /NCGR_PEP_ID=MMETSP0965-20130614/898_1 /ASSEMBLY_ACC=CAM_ASM_000507 /TAXON_ID=4773 /ORGANISM="Schizochytrium aggregatum, Strain ATCC28209" /LENGTH=217 /DNA_ID=CAMNT_0048665273 /DNA_START=134 /DNA_END=786 /DNA_ORIENTATION=+
MQLACDWAVIQPEAVLRHFVLRALDQPGQRLGKSSTTRRQCHLPAPCRRATTKRPRQESRLTRYECTSNTGSAGDGRLSSIKDKELLAASSCSLAQSHRAAWHGATGAEGVHAAIPASRCASLSRSLGGVLFRAGLRFDRGANELQLDDFVGRERPGGLDRVAGLERENCVAVLASGRELTNLLISFAALRAGTSTDEWMVTSSIAPLGSLTPSRSL